VVLRLEDVDVERASQASSDSALADLEWLGLDWDGAPRLQSTGVDRILAAAQRLESEGRAYACVCTRGDLRAQGAPQAGHDELRYAGRCRGRFESPRQAEFEAGSCGLRFRVDPGAVRVHDENFGPTSFDVDAEVGDFMIVRRSKLPAYQLAVVVDDAADGVTEVVRGSDLLASAARQILLQGALDLAQPRYFHVPLMVDATGRRLAKREAALGLGRLRAAGVDPRAIIGFVAEASGQVREASARERMSAREWLPHFDPSRVGTSPIVLTDERLAGLVASR